MAKGKLKHIYSGDDVYIIIKTLGDEQILIILNTGEKQIPIPTQQIKMFLPQVIELYNLKTKEVIDIKPYEILTLEKFSAEIYKIK